MSAYINVPRLDGSSGAAGKITHETAEGLGAVSAGLVDGVPVGSAGVKKRFDRIAKRVLEETGLVSDAGRLDEREQSRLDALTDFVTSGLEVVLGEGSTVMRGEQQPWMFVPERAPALLPSRNLLPRGARTVSYKVREPTGQATWMDPHDTRGLERADYRTEKKSNKREYYGIRWGWTIPELWEARILREDVQGGRQRAANLALDKFRERVSSWGSADHGIPGAFTLGTALIELMGPRFSGGAVSAVEMMERLDHLDQVYRRANSDMAPMGVVMPLDDERAMALKYFGTGQEGPSVLDRARGMYGWMQPGNLRTARRLYNGNAAGDSSRWMFFSSDPENLYIEHMPTMVFGPFNDEMSVDFVAIRAHGGCVSRIPERVAYADFTT